MKKMFVVDGVYLFSCLVHFSVKNTILSAMIYLCKTAVSKKLYTNTVLKIFIIENISHLRDFIYLFILIRRTHKYEFCPY